MYPGTTRQSALELLAEGRSLNAASKQLGISRAAIRDWRDHGVESRRRRESDCPRCAEIALDEAAYGLLFGFYLGDGCVSKNPRTYSLRVSCDRTYPGIIESVGGAIKGVRPTAVVGHVPAPGVTVVSCYWNHWPCVFPQHGPGRKHERKLTLEPWQRTIVCAHPADFLRGLFHSDGCRALNWTTREVNGERRRYDYPRWQFVNSSEDIRRWCCEVLDEVGVAWRQSNWKTISVSTRAGVTLLDELIGPKT